MRILQVSSFMPPHPGGLELAVENLVSGLLERGHDVRWIASADPLPEGRAGHRIRVAAFKSLEQRLHVPLPFWGAPGYRQLYELCRWADLVHVHDCLYPSSAAAVWCARRLRKPSVVTQHIASVPYGPVLDRVQALAYRTLGRAVLEAASAVVAYSAHVPPYFRAIGVRREIDLIPLGYDARFRPGVAAAKGALRRKHGIASDGPLVLFAARLVPKKGVADVVAVQRQLAQRGVTLVVAGDGALAGLLADCPRTLHLPSVAYAEMHELYALSDVLFLPSRGEGLPLTLQEALLCGLNAVVSEDPSYTQNVQGAPGVSLCEGTRAWVSAILAALERPVPAPEVAAWANIRFGRDRSLSGYERVYSRLCASG